MKNIMSICLLSFLLLAGCSKSPKEADQQVESEATADVPASSSGEPITLHARLDFMDASASPSINAKKHLNASFYIETDVTRDGSGASATYSLDSDDSRVQGIVVAAGTLALTSDDVSSSETYNMHNEWNSLSNKPEGKFSIKLPEPSLLGEGLSVAVEIEAPVSGNKKATINSKGQTMDTDVTHSRPVFCTPQAEDKAKEVCTLNFTIDAAPTKAKDPAYETMLESAKTLYAYQGKKNPEGGLIMYSGMVPVYGATTQYQNGHFVTALDQQYTANIDGTDISQHIHLVVWSTKRGDKWQPEGLPPLQKPEAMQ
jgi:hypothetical protein